MLEIQEASVPPVQAVLQPAVEARSPQGWCAWMVEMVEVNSKGCKGDGAGDSKNISKFSEICGEIMDVEDNPLFPDMHTEIKNIHKGTLHPLSSCNQCFGIITDHIPCCIILSI